MTTTMTTTTSSRASPPHTLGAGLAWAIVLGLIAAALIYVFKRPIADVLLGDPEDENLVALAGLLAGALLRVQDRRHHALARAPPGRVPDRRHLAAAARARRR